MFCTFGIVDCRQCDSVDELHCVCCQYGLLISFCANVLRACWPVGQARQEARRFGRAYFCHVMPSFTFGTPLHRFRPFAPYLQAQAEECRQPNCGSDPYDLYICLHEGCGVVSCGRNSKGHAQAHYERAGHPVAMQVKSGMIWCYSCDQQVVENDRGPGDFNVSGLGVCRTR